MSISFRAETTNSFMKITYVVRPHVVDLSFVVTHTHQKIKALFCCINFECYKKFCRKIFLFLPFSSEYIKKRRIYTKLNRASKFTFTSI